MSGAAGAFARKRIGEFEGKAARHGRTRRAAAAKTNAGDLAGCETRAIGPWTGAAVPPRDPWRTTPWKVAHR